MATTITIDLRHVARGLGVPLPQIQAVVELLDEGNTVPFITRYRKDQTGGLDEEQIRQIQGRLTKLRQLNDRKQTILRSIEAQGKLTEDLAQQIQAAGTTKRLEDLYLPFKPKKQTLATQARARGLEVLAREILSADPLAADLDARARDFVNPDRQVTSAADALLGAGHILAEQFSELAELRQRLRDILQRSGKIVSTQIAETKPAETPVAEVKPAEDKRGEGKPVEAPVAEVAETPQVDLAEKAAAAAVEEPVVVESPATEMAVADTQIEDISATEAAPAAEASVVEPVAEESSAVASPAGAEAAASESVATELVVMELAVAEPVATEQAATEQAGAEPAPSAPKKEAVAKRGKKAKPKPTKAEQKKKKLEEQRIKAFRDYFNYGEEIKRIPPHRVLAINRGERAKVLRVRVECDLEAMYAVIDELVVPKDHPHAAYVRGCARDSLTRLVLPSLERELRRELTDRAELHAVEVFAKNLRNLLLQAPIHNRRVLAVDPGFKSGCKLAALDQFGNILEHAVIFLIGKAERKQQARAKIAELIDKYQLSVVAIGNGTGGRDAEDMIAAMLPEELKDKGVAYVIVNEAGASVYSTSRLGREEFPSYDASLRGAISIGRRLQDPLSELVKIEPANIGVGLYQHDVKAKHLETSLDEVVESCVNYVGVDVNTASPALLRYVSGLNQLTARRLYEFRREHGPFRNRAQLHDVSGFGDSAYVQAAGFLKIVSGDNPLDATWIHPESYAVAEQILEKLGFKPADLLEKQSVAALAEKVKLLDRGALAKELGVGQFALNDILAQLCRPGRDPREDLPQPIFRQGILKLENLSAGMELTGTVLNVVDFGAFVDIGMHECGLVHVSHIADKFIRDPHEAVAVGDIVKVWVLGVDAERRRVSLSMLAPGMERQRHARHDDKGDGPRAEGGAQAAQAGEQRVGQARPPRRDGQRSGDGRGGPGRASPAVGGPGRAGQAQGGQQRGDQQRGGPGRGDQQRRDGQRSDRPRFGDQQRGRPPRRGGGEEHRYEMPKPKPAPLKPITDEMKDGKAPMRTFGDLLQFYVAKSDGAAKIELPPIEQPKGKREKKKGPKPAAEEPQTAPPVTSDVPPADQLPVSEPPVAEPSLVGEQPPADKQSPVAEQLSAAPQEDGEASAG